MKLVFERVIPWCIKLMLPVTLGKGLRGPERDSNQEQGGLGKGGRRGKESG